MGSRSALGSSGEDPGKGQDLGAGNLKRIGDAFHRFVSRVDPSLLQPGEMGEVDSAEVRDLVLAQPYFLPQRSEGLAKGGERDSWRKTQGPPNESLSGSQVYRGKRKPTPGPLYANFDAPFKQHFAVFRSRVNPEGIRQKGFRKPFKSFH